MRKWLPHSACVPLLRFAGLCEIPLRPHHTLLTGPGRLYTGTRPAVLQLQAVCQYKSSSCHCCRPHAQTCCEIRANPMLRAMTGLGSALSQRAEPTLCQLPPQLH